jgi:hypothetical protein
MFQRVPAVNPREKRKYLCSGLGVRFCLASAPFERCEEVANAGFPVYKQLMQLSANGKLFHIDDTRVRIAVLLPGRQRSE